MIRFLPKVKSIFCHSGFLFLFFTLHPVGVSRAQSSADYQDLAEQFVLALQYQKFAIITQLMPPREVYQVIAPEETRGLSSDDWETLRQQVVGRLRQAFYGILDQKFLKAYNPQLIRLDSLYSEEIPGSSSYLHRLHLECKYPGHTLSVDLLSVLHHQKWYLTEIIAYQHRADSGLE